MRHASIDLILYGIPGDEERGAFTFMVAGSGGEIVWERQADPIKDVWVQKAFEFVVSRLPPPRRAPPRVTRVDETPKEESEAKGDDEEDLIATAQERNEERADRRKWIATGASVRLFLRDFVASAASDSQGRLPLQPLPRVWRMGRGLPLLSQQTT